MEQKLQDVGIAVSVMTADSLRDMNVQTATDLTRAVPELKMNAYSSSQVVFNIRGVSQNDYGDQQEPPVAVYQDDSYSSSINLASFPTFDLARVEVLRGPQGTLFGRNSPAGVMKFDSAKPGKRFEGYANIGYGRWNSVNLETAVNVPLSSDWSMRVAGIVQRQDDRVHNPIAATAGATADLEGYNDKALRVQALYKSGNFEGLFKVQARDYKGTATTFRANIIKRGTNDLVDGYDDSYYPTDGYNSQTLKSSEVSARLRWDFTGMSLYSITSHARAKFYSRGDVDGGFGAPCS